MVRLQRPPPEIITLFQRLLFFSKRRISPSRSVLCISVAATIIQAAHQPMMAMVCFLDITMYSNFCLIFNMKYESNYYYLKRRH